MSHGHVICRQELKHAADAGVVVAEVLMCTTGWFRNYLRTRLGLVCVTVTVSISVSPFGRLLRTCLHVCVRACM